MRSFFQDHMYNCDMFCRVIDNFGDAGIAWRLAKSLATEKHWRVRLIIDDAATLAAMVPQVDACAAVQNVQGIDIARWDEGFESPAADIVIELFSCFLPAQYEEAIAQALLTRRVAVAALDYLTAEAYAEESNGLASPHPRYGYHKTFLFPGFSEKTCGVIYEAGLNEKFEAFVAQGGPKRVLESLGCECGQCLTLYFFTYPQMPVAAFARDIAADPRPLQILAAPGKASDMLADELEKLHAPHVRLVRAPMVPQEHFDEILLSVDAALVRGEDSTMRAQLAGVPLIWTLYPQKDDIQLDKLAAFAGLYAKTLHPQSAQAWTNLENRLNLSTSQETGWSAWRDHFTDMQQGAKLWRKTLFSQSSLTERIAQTLEKQLKY